MKRYRAIRRLSVDGQEGFVEPGQECDLPDIVADILLARGSVILAKDYIEPVVPPHQQYRARVRLVSRLDNAYIESGHPVTVAAESVPALIEAGLIEPDPIAEKPPKRSTKPKDND